MPNKKEYNRTKFDININYNDTIEKENITITVDSPEILILKAGENIAYRTNSTSIPDIITDKFNMTFVDINNGTINKEFSCYLKISNNQSYLNLLCLINEEGSFVLAQQEHELNEIHYKYNFHIIKNEEDLAPFNMTGRGSQILLTYSNTLNLRLPESVTLKYLMDNPSLEEKILITQNNSATANDIINCSNYGNVKKCIVPISFFEGKKSGYFFTYHSLSPDKSKYVPFYESPPFNFDLFPNNRHIIMRIKYEDNSPDIYLGNKGIITFKTNYNDNIKKVFNETEITLNTNIKDKEGNYYNVLCKIWSPENENIRLLCKLNENLKKDKQAVIPEKSFFIYKNYSIYIIPETYVIVHQKNYNMPFLYSEKQTIELDDGKEEYNLRFKIYSYNNEIIYLDNYFLLDRCKIEESELICTVSKEKLEKNLKNLGVYRLYYLIDEKEYTIFDSVQGINIKYGKTFQKEDIYVNITNLLTNTYEYIGLVTYETISNLTADIETNTFTLYFTNNDTQEPFTCHFKKHEPNNLLLFCYVSNSNNYTLSKIETRKTFNNIHYKYNFIIEPVENNDTINIYDNNVRIHNVYPNNIDFLWDDSANIIYFVYDKDTINGFKLSPDLDNLQCVSTYWGILNCKIYLSYFKNKTSGYYYTYHQDKNGDWQILYEANPIYIRIPKDNKDIVFKIKEEDNKNAVKVGLNGTLYFVIENDTDILNASDIENLSFSNYVYDITGNSNYSVYCKLWKPGNEKLTMFCKLDNIFLSSFSKITLGEGQFTYKDYNVYILSKGK